MQIPLSVTAILHLPTRCPHTFPINPGHLTPTPVSHSAVSLSVYQSLFLNLVPDCKCCFVPLLSSHLNLNPLCTYLPLPFTCPVQVNLGILNYFCLDLLPLSVGLCVIPKACFS